MLFSQRRAPGKIGLQLFRRTGQFRHSDGVVAHGAFYVGPFHNGAAAHERLQSGQPFRAEPVPDLFFRDGSGAQRAGDFGLQRIRRVRFAAQFIGIAQLQLQPGREHGAHAVVDGAEVFFAHPLRQRQHFAAEQVPVRRRAQDLFEGTGVAAVFGCAEDDPFPALSAAAEGYGDARAGHGSVPEPVRHEIVKAALREIGKPFHRDLCDQTQSS